MARDAAKSGKAAGNDKLKIFISYSRKDAAAADAVVAVLSEFGFEVKIDTRDLPFGEEWQKELAEFIRISDTVIWLVSKASIRSEWVNWELDEVKARNKRLVPVMVGQVNPAELPRQLGAIHILPPDRVFDPATDLATLVQVLENDHAWLKQASRLQDRATEWLTNSRATALLLSRGALSEAERWKDSRPVKAPAPAQEVLDLLLASRQAATRRQRWWIGGSLTVALGAIALAGFAYLQREQAVEQQTLAVASSKQAREQAAIGARWMGNKALELFDQSDGKDAGTAILLALEALPDSKSGVDRDVMAEPHLALHEAMRNLREQVVFAGHESRLRSVAWSPDGSRLVTTSDDGTARIWDAASGRELTRIILKAQVWSAAWSPDGTRLLTSSQDKMARVWKADGTLLATLEGHAGAVLKAAFSTDGRIVTASLEDGTARLWAADGTPIAVHNGHCAQSKCDISSIAFSANDQVMTVQATEVGPDGQKLMLSGDGTATLFARDQTPLAVLAGHCPNDEFRWGVVQCMVQTFAFGPDGRIATAAWDGTARIWSMDPNPLPMLAAHELEFASSLYGNNGQFIATTRNGTARLWAADQMRSMTLKGLTDEVTSVAFSPNGRIFTASRDGTAQVWSADGTPVATLRSDQGQIRSVAFGREDRIITVSDNEAVRLWTIDGSPLATLASEAGLLAVGPGGSIITASKDGSRRLWTAEGTEVAVLVTDENELVAAEFGPSGRFITVSGDDTLHIWGADGSPIANLRTEGGTVFSMRFGLDGRIVTGHRFFRDTQVNVWAADGALLKTFPLTSHAVDSVAFGPDGRIVTAASAHGEAQLWSDDGQHLATLEWSGSLDRLQTEIDGDHPTWPSEFNSLNLAGRLWRWFPPAQDLVDAAKARVPRCLTQQQRQSYFLPAVPPRWCITGAGLEREPDSSKWIPKWPYHEPKWREWLDARDSGENPSLPEPTTLEWGPN